MKVMMNEYKELVEQLRDDYADRIYRFFSNESVDSLEELDVNPNFEIILHPLKVDDRRQAVEYRVKEKSTGKHWRYIVGPAMILFSVSSIKFRESLLKDEIITGVFTTKDGFFKNTRVSVGVIFFGEKHSTVWLSSVTNAEEIVALINDPKGYSRKVYFAETLNADNFMPERYNKDLQTIEDTLDKFDSKKLGEIATVIAGANVSSSEIVEEGIPYLRGRDIQNGQLQESKAFVSERVVIKCAKQLLQEGDILLTKQFGQHKIARVSSNDIPAVASSGLFIIRAFGVPEGYLYRYLTSQTGKRIFDEQLTRIEHGVFVPSIRLKDLLELKIPMFDERTMNMFSSNLGWKSKDLAVDLLRAIRYDRYYNYAKMGQEQKAREVEQGVIKSFIESGWNKEEVDCTGKHFRIQEGEKRFWRPDIVLMDDGKLLAIVETKINIAQFSPERIKHLYYIIEQGKIPFLILATGDYYEIHSSCNKIIKKMTAPPSKEFLCSLLEGKEA